MVGKYLFHSEINIKEEWFKLNCMCFKYHLAPPIRHAFFMAPP